MDNIEELTNRLESVGFNRIESKVLAIVLTEDKLISSRDIERKTDIRQPQVSIGANTLCEKGLLEQKIITKIGIGRPEKGYVLAMTKDDFVDRIYEDFDTKWLIEQRNLKLLRSLICKKQT